MKQKIKELIEIVGLLDKLIAKLIMLSGTLTLLAIAIRTLFSV